MKVGYTWHSTGPTDSDSAGVPALSGHSHCMLAMLPQVPALSDHSHCMLVVPPQVPALSEYSHCVPTGPSSVLQSLCPHRSQLCQTSVTVSSQVPALCFSHYVPTGPSSVRLQSLCPHRSQLCASVTVSPQVPALSDYSHCVPTGRSCPTVTVCWLCPHRDGSLATMSSYSGSLVLWTFILLFVPVSSSFFLPFCFPFHSASSLFLIYFRPPTTWTRRGRGESFFQFFFSSGHGIEFIRMGL